MAYRRRKSRRSYKSRGKRRGKALRTYRVSRGGIRL